MVTRPVFKLALFGLLSMAACAGSGSALDANPSTSTSTRTLTGDVSSTDSASLVTSSAALTAPEDPETGDGSGDTNDPSEQDPNTAPGEEGPPQEDPGSQITDAGCLADTIIATDSAGGTITADVNDDCTFSITLNADESYILGMLYDGEFIATLVFDSGIPGFTTTQLEVSDGDETIDLGQIVVSGTLATPTQEPLRHMDRDHDGTCDLDDSDDDNDEIPDDEETDCDLNGTIDDLDPNSSCGQDEPIHEYRVLGVKPHNEENPESSEHPVDLDKVVKARFSCRVDADSVTAESFSIQSDSGDILSCDYILGGRHHGDVVECHHDDMPFLANTVYTATLSGVTCDGGHPIESTTWTWATGDEPSDGSSAEDEIDQSSEDDGSSDETGETSDQPADDSGDSSDTESSPEQPEDGSGDEEIAI